MNFLTYIIKLPFTFMIRAYYKLNPSQYRIDKWKNEGCHNPPREIKVKTILKYAKAKQAKCFVETGTYMGDTTNDVSDIFNKLYSIELDEVLFKNAVKRFKNKKNITIIQGDSGEQLENLLNVKNAINQTTLFWLDGHYSAGITARGELVTPVIKEITSIKKHSEKNGIEHIILIDDANLFNGTDDYPTIEEMKHQKEKLFPNYNFRIENNIIAISK